MKKYNTFTSFSVSDIARAKEFYTKRLGLDEISMENQEFLMFETGGDTRFTIYHKENHNPADFTVLNFEVDDLETVLEQLKKSGVTFEDVEGTDERGIAEMDSTRAAWIKDPEGNWIGFFQNGG